MQAYLLWHCWLGHLTRKIVSEMTYNVSNGTLNTTIPLSDWHSSYFYLFIRCFCIWVHVCVCVCVVYQADSRSSLIKVHFDQLSTSDFWCCLCSRILRQPQGSTSNLNKHLQARHPKEFTSIVQIMSDDSFVKVEDTAGMFLLRDWTNSLNYFPLSVVFAYLQCLSCLIVQFTEYIVKKQHIFWHFIK